MILYNFFTRLRQETDIELDTKQYSHFIQCFLQGHNWDKESIYFLCKTLWLTKKNYKPVFDMLFHTEFDMMTDNQLTTLRHYAKDHSSFKNQLNLFDFLRSKEHSDNGLNARKKEDFLLGQSKEDSEEKSQIPHKQDIKKMGEEWIDILLNIKEESQQGQALAMEESQEKSVPFLFSNAQHLPFQERKALQAWSRYKGNALKKESTEPDIPTTVENISRTGRFSGFHYHHTRKPLDQIFWLSDHKGKMAPFEEWDNSLFQCVKNRAFVKEIRRFYFHKYPVQKQHETGARDYLVFTNKSHSNAVSLTDINTRDHCNKLIVIFSDGNAGKKLYNKETFDTFHDIRKMLTRKTKIIWLNPLENWEESTASFISLLIPMYHVSDDGIHSATRNL